MMKDMKKDEFIEEKIVSYVEGAEDVNVDLSAAHRALAEEKAKRRSARRRMWFGLASACACLLLIVAVLIGVIPALRMQNSAGDMDSGESSPPSGTPQRPPQSGESDDGASAFSLLTAEKRAAGVSELSETYRGALKKLTDLGLSSNVSAEYTLYYAEGQAVLLETSVLYTQNGSRVSATVYTDLSDGKYRAEELAEYASLPGHGDGYTYGESYLNGEHVSMGNFSDGAEYCVRMQSSYRYAFSSFMAYLM